MGHEKIADYRNQFSDMVSPIEYPHNQGRLKLFFSRNFTATIESDERGKEHIYDIMCFTDGSRISGSAGAGAYIEQLEIAKQWSLGTLCTVFQAEMYAILMTVISLLELK